MTEEETGLCPAWQELLDDVISTWHQHVPWGFMGFDNSTMVSNMPATDTTGALSRLNIVLM
eukprot:3968803-Ditylum_brightwellii.AAC.1